MELTPVVARRQFQARGVQGAVRRFFESSTLQTACDCHALRLLDAAEGDPHARAICLYREDSLIPTKASYGIVPERIV